FGTSAGRVAVRLPRRSPRTPWSPYAFRLADVFWLADDRGDADLRIDRNFCTYLARTGTHHPGPESRRPIRDADRRSDLRANRTTTTSEGVPHRRRDPRMGLAHPILHRSAACRRRADHAAQSAGN